MVPWSCNRAAVVAPWICLLEAADERRGNLFVTLCFMPGGGLTVWPSIQADPSIAVCFSKLCLPRIMPTVREMQTQFQFARNS